MAEPRFAIPADFARHMVELYEAQGVAWLARLPTILAECERRWSLQLGLPFGLSYNYVAPAVRADGAEVVVKVGYPNEELLSEIEALRLYAGHGIVQLLDADPAQGAFVLERLRPGATLSTLADDDAATRIAATVMQQLWCPVPAGHSFPSIADWAAGLARLRQQFDGGTGPLPRHLVELAEGLFAELLGSLGEPVLLHGDLHHENILTAERHPWLAIDPKGVVGEREYEVGALLRNPIPQLWQWPNPERITARRVAILAEMLGFERERLIGWGLAQAVLSACWSIEDEGHGWERAIMVASWFATLR
jgi:streptomycin 6-kinase